MTLKQKTIAVIGGLVVAIDELLKSVSLQKLPDDSQMSGEGIIELAVHKNYGIAFDLPLWMPLVIFLTLAILIGLILLIKQNWKKHPWEAVGGILIICGALGNLIDRFVYGFTVDYIIFPLTGSAFNLSDIVILSGLAVLISSRKK